MLESAVTRAYIKTQPIVDCFERHLFIDWFIGVLRHKVTMVTSEARGSLAFQIITST